MNSNHKIAIFLNKKKNCRVKASLYHTRIALTQIEKLKLLKNFSVYIEEAVAAQNRIKLKIFSDVDDRIGKK